MHHDTNDVSLVYDTEDALDEEEEMGSQDEDIDAHDDDQHDQPHDALHNNEDDILMEADEDNPADMSPPEEPHMEEVLIGQQEGIPDDQPNLPAALENNEPIQNPNDNEALSAAMDAAYGPR
ncbi:hypothetical protein ACA910_021459 [Epithemia clementina (nom. ined.)]